MASLTAGINANVLGMRAIADKMNSHSQNIASAGVVGAKRRDVFLSSLNTDSSSGTFTPGGVTSKTVMNVAQVGSSTPSKVATHMAISGQGMFIVTPSTNNTGFGFTRVGTFSVDNNGDFVNHTGQYLKVFGTNAAGVPTASDTSTFSNLVTASTRGLTGTALPTQNLGLSLTLPATKAIAGTETTPITIYDALGGSQTLTLTWTKTAEVAQTSQTWRLSIATPNGAVQAPYAVGIPIIFDNNGKMTSVNGVAPANGQPAGAPNIQVQWTNAAAPSTIAFNLGTIGGTDGIIAQGSNYVMTNQPAKDGRATGKFINASIDQNGYLAATYDNGQIEKFAQIPLATFANVNALQEQSNGVYIQTQASGGYNLAFPNSGNTGTISPSSTEESTIDPAEVFTDMIVDQKRYTANLKGITTIEKMLDALERAIGA